MLSLSRISAPPLPSPHPIPKHTPTLPFRLQVNSMLSAERKLTQRLRLETARSRMELQGAQEASALLAAANAALSSEVAAERERNWRLEKVGILSVPVPVYSLFTAHSCAWPAQDRREFLAVWHRARKWLRNTRVALTTTAGALSARDGDRRTPRRRRKACSHPV